MGNRAAAQKPKETESKELTRYIVMNSNLGSHTSVASATLSSDLSVNKAMLASDIKSPASPNVNPLESKSLVSEKPTDVRHYLVLCNNLRSVRNGWRKTIIDLERAKGYSYLLWHISDTPKLIETSGKAFDDCWLFDFGQSTPHIPRDTFVDLSDKSSWIAMLVRTYSYTPNVKDISTKRYHLTILHGAESMAHPELRKPGAVLQEGALVYYNLTLGKIDDAMKMLSEDCVILLLADSVVFIGSAGCSEKPHVLPVLSVERTKKWTLIPTDIYNSLGARLNCVDIFMRSCLKE